MSREAICLTGVRAYSLADLHFKSTHGGVEVRYECGACHKSSHNYHSISCHVPKCRGPEAPSDSGTTPAVRCEVCDRGFRSASAVSTHKQHVHPDVRNAKRIREAQMREGSNRWTEQEAALLKQLVKEFEGDLNVTFSVTERYLNRSYEEIRSKIRRLGQSAQTIVHGGVAEPDLTTQLLSPRQSKAICTGLRDRLIQLAESYVEPPGDAHTHAICEWLRGADQIPTLVETAAQSLPAELGSRVVHSHSPQHFAGWRRDPHTPRQATRRR
ncbi:hypothetical protein MHYP_G00329450 [Metynnis hypsauchen]